MKKILIRRKAIEKLIVSKGHNNKNVINLYFIEKYFVIKEIYTKRL